MSLTNKEDLAELDNLISSLTNLVGNKHVKDVLEKTKASSAEFVEAQVRNLTLFKEIAVEMIEMEKRIEKLEAAQVQYLGAQQGKKV